VDIRPSRRDVLKSGVLAGAGLATGFSPMALMRALATGGSTCGQLTDIEHVIILIQENRSFDHYFGRYKGVRGFDDQTIDRAVFAQTYLRSDEPLTVPDPLFPFHIDTAVGVPPKPGECTNDLDHQWVGQHQTWDRGRLDNWMSGHITSNGAKDAVITMGYYQGSPARDHTGDVDLYWALADNFTICDNYYCSTIGGTDINRLYSITGTIDPDGWDGGLQFIDTQVANRGNYFGTFGAKGKWVPYPELLSRSGISWKVYSTPDGNFGDNELLYFKDFQGSNPQLLQNAFGQQAFPTDFAADCLAGTLPQVSWLLANLPDTEHAPAPIEWGQDITHTVLTALFNSGLWAKTALFITWDENGGFFDHVAPPVPPAGTPGEFLAHDSATGDTRDASGGSVLGPCGLGFRVPLLVVSPLSRNATPSGPPMVSSETFDHTSLIRFLETRFRVPIPDRDPSTQTPGLSAWRRHTVGDLTGAFNFAAGALPPLAATALPTTFRADPRVLAECVVTGTPGTLDAHTAQIAEGYPGPYSTSVPTQEPSPGRVKRPSGLCGTRCREADGEGEIEEGGSHRGNFQFRDSSCDNQDQNNAQFTDQDSGTDFKSTDMQSVRFDDSTHSVTMLGTGTNAGHLVAFTIVAVDSLAVSPGWFSITLSDGYQKAGKLTQGYVSLT
jgi:phospholipase C